MIQPIKNRSFTNHILQPIKKFTIKRKFTINEIPLIATPIVLYYTNSELNTKSRQLKSLEEYGKAHQPISDRTEYNTRAMERAGYNKQEIKKSLDQDGYIKDPSVQKDLRSQNIPFKGSETQNSEGLSDYTISPEHDTLSGKIPINENIPDNIDFKQLDVSLPPDLQRAVDMSSIDSGDDLISTMFDYVPEDGYDLNKDLFDNFKEMLENLY